MLLNAKAAKQRTAMGPRPQVFSFSICQSSVMHFLSSLYFYLCHYFVDYVLLKIFLIIPYLSIVVSKVLFGGGTFCHSQFNLVYFSTGRSFKASCHLGSFCLFWSLLSTFHISFIRFHGIASSTSLGEVFVVSSYFSYFMYVLTYFVFILTSATASFYFLVYTTEFESCLIVTSILVIHDG